MHENVLLAKRPGTIWRALVDQSSVVRQYCLIYCLLLHLLEWKGEKRSPSAGHSSGAPWHARFAASWRAHAAVSAAGGRGAAAGGHAGESCLSGGTCMATRGDLAPSGWLLLLRAEVSLIKNVKEAWHQLVCKGWEMVHVPKWARCSVGTTNSCPDWGSRAMWYGELMDPGRVVEYPEGKPWWRECSKPVQMERSGNNVHKAIRNTGFPPSCLLFIFRLYRLPCKGPSFRRFRSIHQYGMFQNTVVNCFV